MKYVFIEYTKRSTLVNPRNPFIQDRFVIDYDMDSDEEWQELNGEDIENDDLFLEDDYDSESNSVYTGSN